MKVVLAFSLFIVIFSAAYSTPLSRKDVIDQLLSITEDLMASRHASQQGIGSTHPWPSRRSPAYDSPFYGKDQYYERKLNWDVIVKRMEDRLRSTTLISAHTEERNQLQHLFSKILGLILDYIRVRNELMPGPRVPKMSEANKGIMLPLGEDRSRVQDYIKTRNKTLEKEKANEMIREAFMCLVNNTLNYVDFLKKGKTFGILREPILDMFQILIAQTDFISYFEDFLSIVDSVIHHNSSVGKEQGSVDFNTLRKIMRGFFREYAVSNPNGTFENLMNVVSVLLLDRNQLTAEDRDSFTKSINFLLDNYFLTKIEGDENKKAIKDAVNNILPAVFKVINGEQLNMSHDSRNHLLKNIVIVLATFNGAVLTNNKTQIDLVNQFLSKNPSNEELQTKSLCLLAFTLRTVLEGLLNMSISDKMDPNEVGMMKCGIKFVKNGYRFLLDYIPKDLNDVGCSDMNVGFQGAARRKMVMKTNARFFAPFRVNWKRRLM